MDNVTVKGNMRHSLEGSSRGQVIKRNTWATSQLWEGSLPPSIMEASKVFDCAFAIAMQICLYGDGEVAGVCFSYRFG